MKHPNEQDVIDTDGAAALANDPHSRRRVLGVIATSAVALPVLGLTGCGGDSGDSAPASQTPAPEASGSAMEEMAESARAAAEDAAGEVEDIADAIEDSKAAIEDAAEDASAAVEEAAEDARAAVEEAAAEVQPQAPSGNRVGEDEPQARALSYKLEASDVDAASQPRYAAGQMCGNCALYQGGDNEWGGCALFGGREVKRTGWCSAYAAAG